MKTAIITGVAGQDGPYLAELLIAKGYHVHGVSAAPARSTPAGWTTFTPTPMARRRR